MLAVEARLVRQELDAVRVTPPSDAHLPTDVAVRDATTGEATTLEAIAAGRVSLVLPVDYTCGNVCDPMLAMTLAALDAAGLSPGDSRLTLFGIDPRDGLEAANLLLARDEAETRPVGSVRALISDSAGVERFSRATGYGFRYDAGTDSFAHPAALLVFLPNGRLGRILSPLALNGRDLRLALVEAGEGKVGGFRDSIALLCYGYDAASGTYTPLILRLVSYLAVLTASAIGLLILVLAKRTAKRA